MRIISQAEYALLCSLMSEPDAASLQELAQRMETSPDQVGFLLDGLVGQEILEADASYHNSAIGEMVYGFSDKEHAQELFEIIRKRNPGLTGAEDEE